MLRHASFPIKSKDNDQQGQKENIYVIMILFHYIFIQLICCRSKDLGQLTEEGKITYKRSKQNRRDKTIHKS